MPKRLAMELALTGDTITANRALEVGLVNQVTKKGEALSKAIEMANKIKANGPLAVALSKEVINKATDWTSEEMMERQLEIVMPIFSSEDAKEGAAAFAEKRKPVWTGK